MEEKQENNYLRVSLLRAGFLRVLEIYHAGSSSIFFSSLSYISASLFHLLYLFSILLPSPMKLTEFLYIFSAFLTIFICCSAQKGWMLLKSGYKEEKWEKSMLICQAQWFSRLVELYLRFSVQRMIWWEKSSIFWEDKRFFYLLWTVLLSSVKIEEPLTYWNL